jgi:hypothetical protein
VEEIAAAPRAWESSSIAASPGARSPARPAWIQRRRGPRGGQPGALLRGVRVAALVLKLAVPGSLLGDQLSDMTESMAATPQCSTPLVTVRVLVGL